MKISFVTLFPDMIESVLSDGLLSKAIDKALLQVEVVNLRDEALTAYKSVDDTVYGGGDGAVIQFEPLKKSIDKIKTPDSYVVYLSPQGQVFNQAKAVELSLKKHLVLVSGRYAGVDQRFIRHCVDEELSVGDYVLNGGELPSLVVTEAIARLLPGALGHSESHVMDSFGSGLNGLLEAPQFTKPSDLAMYGQVPDVLLSGDHKKIQQWRQVMSWLITLRKRPDLFGSKVLHKDELERLYVYYNQISEKDKKILDINDLEDKIKQLIKESNEA